MPKSNLTSKHTAPKPVGTIPNLGFPNNRNDKLKAEREGRTGLWKSLRLISKLICSELILCLCKRLTCDFGGKKPVSKKKEATKNVNYFNCEISVSGLNSSIEETFKRLRTSSQHSAKFAALFYTENAFPFTLKLNG